MKLYQATTGLLSLISAPTILAKNNKNPLKGLKETNQNKSTCTTSLPDFLASRDYADFPDLDSNPAKNYKILYRKSKKNKGSSGAVTTALLTCKKVRKGVHQSNFDAYNVFQNLPKHERMAKFYCLNGGTDDEKWVLSKKSNKIPNCYAPGEWSTNFDHDGSMDDPKPLEEPEPKSQYPIRAFARMGSSGDYSNKNGCHGDVEFIQYTDELTLVKYNLKKLSSNR